MRMTQRWLATVAMAAVMLAVLLAAPSADALEAPSCCACISDNRAEGGAAGMIAIPALFCAETADTQALSEQCDDLNGTLICLAEAAEAGTAGAPSSCAALLALEDIACPGAAKAPLLSPWALGAVALALGAFGVGRARRLARA